MEAKSVEQMLADMVRENEVTNEDVRKIRLLLSEVSKLPMINEVSVPKVGRSALAPTKTCKKYKVQIYIYMHDYLDEIDIWRRTFSLERVTCKTKAKEVGSNVKRMIDAVLEHSFCSKDKHDLVDAMETWLNEFEKNRSGELSTIDAYKSRFKLVRWYFDQHPVNVEDFTAVTMNQFCKEALNHGRVKPIIDKETGQYSYKLSRRTVRDAHGLIYNFFERCGCDYSLTVNPCMGTKVPSSGKKDKTDKTEQPWMELDVYKKYRQWLLDNSCNNKYKHLHKLIEIVEVGIQTGMRREELCGLHWDKVSFDSKTIRIAQTRILTSSGAHDKDGVKTDASYRIYRMTDSLSQCLKTIQQRQIESGLFDSKGFVFKWEEPNSKSYGEAYNPGYLTKLFKKSVVVCPYTNNNLHFHSLRHSTCSICYYLGWSMEETADWLGHDETIARTVYNHYKRIAGEEKVKVLGDAFA